MEKTGYSKRRQPQFRKRRRGSPVTVLLILIVALFLIYLVVGVITGGKAKAYEDYIRETNKIITKSNDIARGFNSLKENVGTVSHLKLKERLTTYAKESKKLEDKLAKVDVPDDMEKAHFYLTLCLDLRTRGMSNYKPALFNALKDVDLEVASTQVAMALKDLALSDRAYTLFSDDATALLKKENVKLKTAKSKFLTEDTAYERISLIPYLQQLKGIKSLEETHALLISDLSVKPKQKQYNKGRKLATLPVAKRISVTVVVTNQGNQIEFNVPVVAILKSTAGTEEQREEIRIVSIDPQEKKTVTLTGLSPSSDEEVTNLLTVTAGPVPEEKNTGDNSIEYKFLMSD